MRGRFWQRVGLALGAILLALVALEVGMRLWYASQSAYHSSVDDPRYHHRYKSHHRFLVKSPDFRVMVQTNNLGLRGTRELGPEHPGVARVLMLGDSFTFGVGVEEAETFCAGLQQTIAAQRLPVEIINAGTGSYSPILHDLTLRGLYLPVLKPDAVVVWLDWSDLQDDWYYHRRLLYDQDHQPIACHPDYVDGRYRWIEYLVRHSALMRPYTAIRARVVGAALRLKFGRPKTATTPTAGRAVHEEDPVAYDRYLMLRGRSQAGVIRPHWQRTAAALLRIRDVLRQQRIPFILVAYPQGVQVGADQWAAGREMYGFARGRVYDDPYPVELVETFAREHQVALINLTPAFVAAQDRRLFFDWDGHFTPEGHRVAAEAVFAHPVFRRLLLELQQR